MSRAGGILDLGVLAGEVLLFGGPYSNLQATEALFGAAQSRGILRNQMICTGDVVAYCAEPAQTVALIRKAGVAVVAGNCELQLAAAALDCGCGFEAGSACDVLSAGWFAHLDREIGPEDRGWMGALPQMVTFTHDGLRVAVIHGGATDVSRFIWETSPEAEFGAEIAAIEARVGAVDMVVAGHCGLPFRRQVGRVEWINAGVIGMPAHDGRQATRFAILSESGVEFCALAYDAALAFAKMQSAGLRQGYDRALKSGYWPSEDVLPPDLRLGSRDNG